MQKGQGTDVAGVKPFSSVCAHVLVQARGVGEPSVAGGTLVRLGDLLAFFVYSGQHF